MNNNETTKKFNVNNAWVLAKSVALLLGVFTIFCSMTGFKPFDLSAYQDEKNPNYANASTVTYADATTNVVANATGSTVVVKTTEIVLTPVYQVKISDAQLLRFQSYLHPQIKKQVERDLGSDWTNNEYVLQAARYSETDVEMILNELLGLTLSTSSTTRTEYSVSE